ncbi:methyltransferase domain-containing protein [Sphingomonas lutea]|uniref:Methyltransferase domain-containing protein n=1 Tax=Sphingomonas lutea TaxID=1045317 RepID=A0A7G9SGP9_9SPHN|nr:methyltransferase domain-containing protein [Sphingomonas lutea]
MSATGTFAFETRSSCPACGSPESRRRFAARFDQPPIAGFISSFYKIDPARLDGTYDARQCTACGTFFQAEVGNDALLEQLYTHWVFEIGDPMRDPHYAFDVTHPALSRDGHELMTAAAVLGRDLQAMRTLDFGMGWAGWARVAKSLGCDSYGHELSADRVAYAATHGIKPFDPKLTYHFINTEQVFEHLTDPLGAAHMLAGVLAPGGILKISLPSPTASIACSTGSSPAKATSATKRSCPCNRWSTSIASPSPVCARSPARPASASPARRSSVPTSPSPAAARSTRAFRSKSPRNSRGPSTAASIRATITSGCASPPEPHAPALAAASDWQPG